MKKKSNFESIIIMLCSLTLIFSDASQAVGENTKVISVQEKYIDNFYQVDKDNNIQLHIFLGTQKLSTVDNNNLYFNLNDHLSSLTIITNQNGDIVEENEYDNFGQIIYTSSTIDNSYKFAGQELDVETSLGYFHNRYYDMQVARFLSIDPLLLRQPYIFLADPQQLNSYSYARNNPISFIDPLGLSTATVNPIPNGGWRLGDNMGQFNGVVAYYNGIASESETHSCVEYAKRYMSQIYGINSIGTVGDPKNMWNIVGGINNNLDAAGSPYNFVQHNNGESFTLPNAGDLLIWTQGTYGHIMVVTESNFDDNTNTGYVEIMDQNASDKALRTYNVNKTDNGYSIMKNKNTPMAGWLSPVSKNNNNNKPVNNTHSATQTVTPPRMPFFQRLWNNTKQFFKNIF